MQFGMKALIGAGLYSFGDSFTLGLNASTQNHWYITRLANFIGGTLNNQAVSGTGTITSAKNLLATVPLLRKSAVTVLSGFNDIARSGSAAYPKIACNYRAMIAASFLREAVAASAMIATGNWTALGSTFGGKAFALGGTPMYTSDASGATLSWEFFGETLVVGAYTQLSTGNYKDFSISIDGGTPIAYSSIGNNDEAYPSAGFNAKVLKNLGFGKHTVVISQSSGGSYTVVDYVGTLIEPSHSAAMLVGSIPTKTQWTYNGNTIDQTVVDDANAVIAGVVSEFSEWPVVYVPVEDFYVPGSDISSDGIHPNDFGHYNIFRAFKSRISLG